METRSVDAVTHSIVINRPIEEVFDVATCQQRCVVWQSGMVTARKLTDGPVGVGTEYEQTSQMLGFQATNHPVITLWEPSHRFAYHSEGSRSTVDVEMTFTAVDGGTQMTVSTHMPQADDMMSHFTESLVYQSMKRMMKTDLENLKELMESEEPIVAG
jgi:uncharacterized protein YndB with AHSA1/START domain